MAQVHLLAAWNQMVVRPLTVQWALQLMWWYQEMSFYQWTTTWMASITLSCQIICGRKHIDWLLPAVKVRIVTVPIVGSLLKFSIKHEYFVMQAVILLPPYLHFATSEMWCWSGGRGILKNCLCVTVFVYCYSSAERYEQFLQLR